MKHLEYLVGIPPEEVMTRLSWVVETSLLKTLGWQSDKKKFIGTIKGQQFGFRVRRATHNSFAPVCAGQVVPVEGGAKIIIDVKTSYGCQYAFGGVFLVILLFFTMLILWATRAPDVAAKFAREGIPSFAPVLLPIGLAVLLVIGFVILRVFSGNDEQRLLAIFPSLFSDVLITAPRP
jgi:hypothetical protein